MLADDPIYKECIRQARMSPCQKKGVGAVLVDSSGFILEADHNRTIEGLESLCTPTCIRFSIQSRTESMIGACGHAEERILWKAKNIHVLWFCDLYVAGVTAEKEPEQRKVPEFTCLRCAVAMYYAGLRSVYVAYQGTSWVRQMPEEALASAKAYALGEKKI